MAGKYLSARQKLAILEPLLSPEISGLFENSYGAHAYIAIRLTLVLDLIRDIWAFALDPDGRAPSLRNIWALVENDELHAALRAAAIQPYNAENSTFSADDWSDEEMAHWHYLWEAKDRERQSASFDAAFQRVASALPALLASDLAKKIDSARKKTIAHYDMRATKDGPKLSPLSEIGLKWNDPRAFLDALGPILWDVVLLATWGSYDTAGFENTSRLYAADFWARLQGKPPVDENDIDDVEDEREAGAP